MTRPASTSSSATTASTSPPDRSAAELARRSGDPLFASGGVELADGHLGLRLQGGGRDRRARRQHQGAARGHRRRRAAAPRRAGRVGRGDRARPHPLGQRRHHLAAQRPPAELRRARRSRPAATAAAARRCAVRHRRAQRRRRQLRRPQGDRGPADPGRDHDRREGDPDARVAEPGRRAPAGRVLPPLRRPARGIGGHRRQLGHRPGRPALRPARQRPGAVRRPGRRRLSSWRPSPTAWSRRPTGTSASTARRRPTPTTPARRGARSCACPARRPARSRASSGWPTTVPPCRSSEAELAAAQITTRDIDRGDAPHFLLKEISEAPASFRKTLRGKLVDRDGVAGGRAPRGHAAQPSCGPIWPPVGCAG